jgi:hypothetical protein
MPSESRTCDRSAATPDAEFDARLRELARPYRVMTRPAASPYAIFFDDASHHFTRDCRAVFGLRVASGRDGRGAPPPLSPPARALWHAHGLQRMFDPRAGVKARTFDQLRGVCGSSNVRCVIFDFDKTLSVLAGLDTTLPPTRRAAECYFGGLERMRAMRSFFRAAFWRRWRVRVLTANPVARESVRYFRALLGAVGGAWVPIEHVGYAKVRHVAVEQQKYGLRCSCTANRS